jgi:hypothetical protein
MQTRGIIYLYWGDKIKPDLDRSIESVKRHHPELPFECFRLPDDATLLDKASMFALTPFDTTLFLDTDTVVLDRLDFGFEKAESFGLACCINECPWARRYADIGGDQIEYNTGVLFFTRQAEPVFQAWANLAGQIDSSIVFRRDGTAYLMPHNDQAGFSQAIVETGFNPFILPLNWNLRPTWQRSFFGPVKIWHCRHEVPMELRSWNEEQRLESSIIRYSGGDL